LYVRGALRRAAARGAKTIFVSCVGRFPGEPAVNVAIRLLVGPEVVTDPAYLVTRNMEDFVTWVDSSKIKQNIMKYRDEVDDFDILAA